MIGQTIAHFKVTAKLGAGGMGEVYRATDSKLGRDVALKVLPAAFAQDAQRMARFQREAQVLASLNHPNIAGIYGFEQQDGVHALAMELVEGATLAERIEKGAIPLEEALVIAGQIVDALEAAHEKGIIHRDLKPANVKISPEGKVKVLDFGLAKALDEGEKQSDISASPTLSMAATRAGIILGTAAYMSPEQARGSGGDRRADIWSFGVVLFEMLCGKQLFGGESVSDTLAAVLRDEIRLDQLPPSTPHHIRKLLRRCLERDPKRRLRDIGEARLAIEEYLASPADASVLMSAVSAPSEPKWRRNLPWALAGVMTVAFASTLVPRLNAPPPAADVSRFEIDLGPSAFQGSRAGSRLAISPDGRNIVFVAQRAGAQATQLFLRSMDNLEILPLPGTEGAHQPFFSPDGQWLGFSGDGKVKKIPLAGGVPVTLCEARENLGGTPAAWSDSGHIFFTQDGKLKRIPEGGGVPELVAESDLGRGERIAWVSALPGGRGVLVVVGGTNQFSIDLVRTDTGQRERLIEEGSWPRYLASGHILYAQYSASGDVSGFTGGLLVVPFDLKNLRRTGSPIPVVEGVYSGSGGAGYYDVSTDGTFVYRPGAPQQSSRQLAWLDGSGKIEVLSTPLRAYRNPALSPDGMRVALALASPTQDIQVYDLKRGTLQRLTFEGVNNYPVFTPDGKRVVYASSASGADPSASLWWTSADGSSPPERLTTSQFRQAPFSVSPDGRLLVFSERTPDSSHDIYVLPLEGDRRPQAFLKTKFTEYSARFSPDGKWMAYTSNESGQTEVYVQAYPGPGGKLPISNGGGDHPQWSRDGKQLYYFLSDSVYVVDVITQPAFRAGAPRLVGARLGISEINARNWSVAADGRIFLAKRPDQAPTEQTQVRVVQNFLTEVRRRLPTNK